MGLDGVVSKWTSGVFGGGFFKGVLISYTSFTCGIISPNLSICVLLPNSIIFIIKCFILKLHIYFN